MPELRRLTVNNVGKQITSICLFCNKYEVPIERWNKRCTDCATKQAQKDTIEKQQIDMGIGKRLPAAIIEITDKGKTQEVFVDKFGREVENPGYDLKNDPRGWNYTRTQKGSRSIIT